MQLERRKAQSVGKVDETSDQLRLESPKIPYPALIARWARDRKGKAMYNLIRFCSIDNLRQAYHQIDGTKAMGPDGISKDQYGRNLEENLQALHAKMRQMAYRPGAARIVFVPKPDGRQRLIAISNLEDKLVQQVVANILIAIYDRDFKPFSFGFRPKRSCHGAVNYLYNKLRKYNLPWVVDIDLQDFFNTIDHKQLIKILERRIADRTLLRYVYRMLRSGILVEGAYTEAEQGTPQGSIVSPVLANIYLHHVVDEWFDEIIRPELRGTLVRYADDMVAAFPNQESAEEFARRLEMRLLEFGLHTNRDKTKTIDFDRQNPKRETVDFLGFTFFWGKWQWPNRTEVTLKVRTSRKALFKKIEAFGRWIKANRSRFRLDVLWDLAAAKLRGHYNYYGVSGNRSKLYHFYQEAIRNLFRWLNRRSQKHSYSWRAFLMRLRVKPLPRPPDTQRLISLTDPRIYYA